MATGLTVGDQLQAMYSDGYYYLAEVVAVSSASKRQKAPVKVCYAGYDEEAWLPTSSLKSKKLKADASKGKAKGKATVAFDYSGLEKGAILQALSDGTYYTAEVLSVSASASRAAAPVRVRYVGYTSASDEWLGADRLRSKAITKAVGNAKAKGVENSRSSRLVAAVRGAFVSDAACMPLHWIYEHAKLDEIVGAKSGECEFWPEPSGPFYAAKDFPGHYTTGQFSPYAEQMAFFADYLRKLPKDADLDLKDCAEAFKVWLEAYTGRPDGAGKEFLANMQSGDAAKVANPGAIDSQSNCYQKVAIVMRKWPKDWRTKLEALVRLHQNTDLAAEFSLAVGIILEAVLDGKGMAEAVDLSAAAGPEAKKAVELVKKNAGRSGREWLTEWGKENFPQFPAAAFSCGLPQSFFAVAHLLLNHKAGDFAGTSRQNILLGGDQCSRALALGAVLGAVEGVPDAWAKRAQAKERAPKAKALEKPTRPLRTLEAAGSEIPIGRVARVYRAKVSGEAEALKLDAYLNDLHVKLSANKKEKTKGFIKLSRTVCKTEWAYEVSVVWATFDEFKAYKESDFRKEVNGEFEEKAKPLIAGELYSGVRVYNEL